jgi:hypothetical protein
MADRSSWDHRGTSDDNGHIYIVYCTTAPSRLGREIQRVRDETPEPATWREYTFDDAAKALLAGWFPKRNPKYLKKSVWLVLGIMTPGGTSSAAM